MMEFSFCVQPSRENTEDHQCLVMTCLKATKTSNRIVTEPNFNWTVHTGTDEVDRHLRQRLPLPPAFARRVTELAHAHHERPSRDAKDLGRAGNAVACSC